MYQPNRTLRATTERWTRTTKPQARRIQRHREDRAWRSYGEWGYAL